MLHEDPDLGADVLRRVESSALRVQMARRFHNDAVREVRRVRTKAAVRAFRLAGHADLPEPVEFHDALPRLDEALTAHPPRGTTLGMPRAGLHPRCPHPGATGGTRTCAAPPRHTTTEGPQ